ncbi:MAG: nucleotidyltransferase domain-containing protein [Deltaproteobacteria bacterium]|nr:nucleotidyltransferase domain-containing protein [Deltaproteobacteria bacterium]MBM4285004.1 nucleotidyltransferase domain-containing protein [Deltaproteobacteria bacterium]
MANPPSRPFDTSRWEQALEEEARRRERERQEVLTRALARLPAYFAGKRVAAAYLTGSVLREGHFYAFSDVDIAVEGLEEDYFRVMVELEELLDRQVDLIELERCRFAETIRERGWRVI